MTPAHSFNDQAEAHELITAHQAARLLARSVSTLKRWRRMQNTGPEWVQIAGRIHYRRAAVLTFLEEHTRKPSFDDRNKTRKEVFK
jgi:hypothetical protein